MNMNKWIVGLAVLLFGASTFAAKDNGSSRKGSNKEGCVCPSPKYQGQGEKQKCNNGHGNNKDGVDRSNPGRSKPGQDSDPAIDDEKKTGKKS